MIDVLLLDPAFPRSARYSLDRLRVSMERIANQGPEPSPACSALSELAAFLSSKKPAELIKSGLHQSLLHIQDGCAAIGDEVFRHYLKSD